MHFTVTGATGLLGNNLVRILMASGNSVRVVVREQSNRRALTGLDVEVLEGDVTDRAITGQLSKDTDGVFHCAAHIWLGKTKLELSRSVNVDATANIAAACRENSIRLVHVSSVDALAPSTKKTRCTEEDVNPPNPSCAYVITKREAEQAVLREVAQGLDAVIVNPGFMVGPYDWKPSSGEMMLAIAKGFVPFAPGGGFSVCDVRNVAAGVVAAMEKGRSGQRYILAGHDLRYVELWKKIAKVVGQRPPWVGMGPVFARIVGRGADVAGFFARRELTVNSASIRLGQHYHYYDSSKAMSELGYELGDVDRALQDAWQFFLENGYAARGSGTRETAS